MKEQENVTHFQEEKKHSMETNPKMAQMLEF